MTADDARDDLLELHRRAITEFGLRVHAVRPDQWRQPTPCREWDVRALVNHLVVEQLWVPPLLDGATLEQVGDRFDGDQLGDDPVGAWDRSSVAAQDALGTPGALDRVVHLSYGDRRAAGYCWELTADLVIHAWDLARAIGGDERLDPELVEVTLRRTEPHVAELAASGLFDPPVPVAADADPQTRLLALAGRRA